MLLPCLSYVLRIYPSTPHQNKEVACADVSVFMEIRASAERAEVSWTPIWVWQHKGTIETDCKKNCGHFIVAFQNTFAHLVSAFPYSPSLSIPSMQPACFLSFQKQR